MRRGSTFRSVIETSLAKLDIAAKPGSTATSIARGPANGKDITAAMATHLVKVGIPATEREAIRLLAAHGFRYGDVAVLAEDALFEARQCAVRGAVAGGDGHGG